MRFSDTNEWDEDWFIAMSGEYQHLWKFIKDKCDVAGVWKPNIAMFQALSKFTVRLDSFFKKVNGDKQRIIILDNGRWFIPGFIKFQYFNKQDEFELLLNNPLHKSIYQSLVSNQISLGAVRGLAAVYQPSKDKDKVNKKKKELIIEYVFNSEKFKTKYNEWVDFRKKAKKPLTAVSVKKQMEFLSEYDEETACSIIDTSIMNGYQGLFPPKNTFNHGQQSTPKGNTGNHGQSAGAIKLARSLADDCGYSAAGGIKDPEA